MTYLCFETSLLKLIPKKGPERKLVQGLAQDVVRVFTPPQLCAERRRVHIR